MPPVKRLLAAGTVALSLALGACKDSTGPGSVNPATMDNQLQQMGSTFDGNAAFQSLLSLSGSFPTFSLTSALRASLPALRTTSLSQLNQPLSRSLSMAHVMIPRAPGAIEALFPANVLGKTYVWDPDSGYYRVDGTITGAPANGVRFRLYNTGGGFQPIIPLQLLGYVELRDQSTAAATIVGITLKLSNTTVADYTVSDTKATNSESVNVAGYITAGDGTGRIDFNHSIGQTVSGADTTVDLVSTLSNSSTSIRVEIHGDQSGNGTELLRVSNGGNTVEISGTVAGGDFNGSVKFNGTVVSTVSTSTGSVVFTGANGHTLSASDQAHLSSLFAGLELTVFVSLLGLLAPVLILSAFSGVSV